MQITPEQQQTSRRLPFNIVIEALMRTYCNCRVNAHVEVELAHLHLIISELLVLRDLDSFPPSYELFAHSYEFFRPGFFNPEIDL